MIILWLLLWAVVWASIVLLLLARSDRVVTRNQRAFDEQVGTAFAQVDGVDWYQLEQDLR